MMTLVACASAAWAGELLRRGDPSEGRAPTSREPRDLPETGPSPSNSSRKLAKLAGVTLAIARFLSIGCKS